MPRTRDEIDCWLTDMDAVLVHENQAIPGAAELIQQWTDRGNPFLVLTNNSIFTPRDLAARQRASGLKVPEESLWTSALATADFLQSQYPGGSAYVVGKPNPMMFRSAMNRIGAHSENTAMIGDRMDTDIVAGIEAGLRTFLVLTGISDHTEIERYPFRPDEVIESVADLLDPETGE